MPNPSPKPFSRWLENQADKDTPVGQMARHWIEDSPTTTTYRRGENPGPECADYILGGWWGNGGPAQVATLAQALASYATYLKRWAARQS